jgi:hypothetical protein
MTAGERETIVARLIEAFGDVTDLTPDAEQPLHARFEALWLPEPWTPSPAKAMSVWKGWPGERPEFAVEIGVVGEGGQPPRSDSDVYILGGHWRAYSFSFQWAGDDPVLAIQLWLNRFLRERT